MSYGAAFTLLAAFATGVTFRFDWSAAYLGSLVYLAVCASVLGFGCYLTLVQRIGADRAAYASVLFPVVALGLSTLFEGYRWSWAAAAGVALVLAGNVIVLARRAAPLAAGPRAVRGEDYRARLHASDGAASRGIDAR
jgi:drug/metabolite transporter (DMT)-like permease